MRISLLTILLLGCLSHFSLFAYPGMQQSGGQPTSISQIKLLPKPYPITSIPFKDETGKPVQFDQFRGKVIMVNMWATWCPPCIRELPALARLGKMFDSKQFEVLPVSIDRDGKKTVEPFLTKIGMADFSTYYDETQELDAVFPLDTIPATFILNSKGELIAFVRTFVDWEDKQAIELIQELIDKDRLSETIANSNNV